MERARFEAKLSDLRGRRLMAVDYWDVHSDDPEPARWDYGDWHHAVMGIGLGTRFPLGASGTGAKQAGRRHVVEPARTVDVPIALRLDVDAGAVWFAAAMPQLPDPRRVFVPADEIMVVFSGEKMRDMGFADPAFLG